MIARSLRVRLALWYAVVLGGCLAILAGITYAWVARATDRHIDDSLRDVALAFVAAWQSAQSSNPDRAVRADEVVRTFRADEFEIVVFDEAQRELASNSRTSRVRRPGRAPAGPGPSPTILRRPDLAALFREAGANGEALASLAGPRGAERAYAVAVTLPGRRQVVAVIQDLVGRAELLSDLRRASLLLVPFGLLIAFAGGVFLAGRALAPIRTMATRTDRIVATTLHERLPDPGTAGELSHLAAVINRLLERLERAFDQQRGFMAVAAHELRTPVTVVRAEADLALSRATRPEAEYRDALDTIREESRRMTRLVDDLLVLGRAEAAGSALSTGPVSIGEVVADVARRTATLAARHDATVHCDAGADLILEGDRALLQRAVQNLADNAVKYGRRGGTVWLEAGPESGGVRIVVRDDGPGIAPADQPRIFERFVRGEDARIADQEGEGAGAGLGLAIARWVAEAHGGTLTLTRSDGSGSAFRIWLPAAPPGTAGPPGRAGSDARPSGAGRAPGP